MVEVASKGDVAYQFELWLGRYPSGGTGTPAFTQVLGVETIGMPEQSPEDIDVTHMQSPGATRETIPGLLPVVDYAQEMQDWPDDPGQIILDELATLTAQRQREDIVVEMVIGDRRRSYRAYVNSFTPTGTVGGKAMASAAFKVMNRLATNPRVVTP